jgi:hypothetical protein
MSVGKLCGGSTILVVLVAFLALSCEEEGGEAGADGCDTSAECEAAEYCEKPAGDCEGAGDCVVMPETCPDVSAPVCGCDSHTYGNECEAAAVGVNVASEGECPPPACTGNDDCEADEYCERIVGDCAASGVCAPVPWPCSDIQDPVCGCDGSTHRNACYAAAADVGIASDHECGAIVCADDDGCAGETHCKKDVGDCGGTGVCAPVPWPCSDIQDPVCGCDGSTHRNACYAAAAGIDVASLGECP